MPKAKKDLLLVIIILIIASTGFTINYVIHQKPASYIEISVNAEVTQTLDLNTDAELEINGWNGGTNHLVIQNGIAWIDDASCPDKVCIRHGKIQLNGQMIACRPNRLIVRVVTQEH